MKNFLKVLCLLCAGCMIGVHRNVIKACITGGEMPEAPAWHFWCK